MSLGLIKQAGLLSLLIVLAAGWLWINRQQELIDTLHEHNTRLGQQLERMQSHVDALKVREEELSAALTERQQTQQRMEENNEQHRQQLRQAVVQAPCAAQSVPDNVIRLQREALHGNTTTR